MRCNGSLLPSNWWHGTRFEGKPTVPTISEFYGIRILIYYRDHPPPHIHVDYQGQICQVSIESGEIMNGRLAKTASKLVKEWVLSNQLALRDNWTRAEQREPLLSIEGLE
jgi:hypothetical protein